MMLGETFLANFIEKGGSNSSVAISKPALLDRCVLLKMHKIRLVERQAPPLLASTIQFANR